LQRIFHFPRPRRRLLRQAAVTTNDCGGGGDTSEWQLVARWRPVQSTAENGVVTTTTTTTPQPTTPTVEEDDPPNDDDDETPLPRVTFGARRMTTPRLQNSRAHAAGPVVYVGEHTHTLTLLVVLCCQYFGCRCRYCCPDTVKLL